MKLSREYLHPHYILNSLAIGLFVTLRSYFPICITLFELNEDGECQLDWRDTEVLMFFCFVLVLRSRRWKSLTAKDYIGNMFFLGKCGNALLFLRQDFRWGFLYLLLCIILFLAVPEPSYSGPDNVTFFRGQALDETLIHESDKIFLVEFYAAWSPPCSRFAATFANLSLKYGNDMFKFGKVDVTRYPIIASKYKVDSGVSSKNLPTLILFKNGVEVKRKPFIDHKGSVSQYIFKERNIIIDFDLNEMYAEAKKNLQLKNKKDKKEQ